MSNNLIETRQIKNLDSTLSAKADLVGGLVPASQLPAYVDDVLESANLAAFPVTGESNKIYVALDTNQTYRWTGSSYVQINAGITLGETSSTAYRGDRGKLAYDHTQILSGNPHNVTKAEVGLGNVDNTSDSAKNSATATLTNKTINGANNTITNIPQGSITGLSTDLSGKEPAFTAGTNTQYLRGDKTWQTLDKAAVGLNNVDNTSDSTKNSATATLTNKTISGATNTITNIPQSSITGLSTDLSGRELTIAAGTTTQYWRGDKTWQTLDKAAVGLNNVDNTSDSTKNSATATLTNKTISGDSNIITNISQGSITGLSTDLSNKEPLITTGTTGQYWRGDKTFQTLDKVAVGLANVDNTSDLNKPISTATQTALNAKANLAGFSAGNVSGVVTLNANNGYSQSMVLTGDIGLSIINQASNSVFNILFTASGATRVITLPANWFNTATGLGNQTISITSGVTQAVTVYYNGFDWYYTAVATGGGSGTVTAANITDATTAGRNLLTAATTTAQKTLLGLGELSVGTLTFHPYLLSAEYNLLSGSNMTIGTDIATLFTPTGTEKWHLATCFFYMSAWAGTGTLTTAPAYQLVVGASNTAILNSQSLNGTMNQAVGVIIIGGATAPNHRPVITNANPLKLRCVTSVVLGTGTITDARMKVSIQLVRVE